MEISFEVSLATRKVLFDHKDDGCVKFHHDNGCKNEMTARDVSTKLLDRVIFL